MFDSLTCKIYSRSNSAHLQQIYTGFALLHQARVARVEQTVERVPHLRYGQEVHLQVVVNNRIKLFYDLHDGAQIDEKELADTDFYFKRSYNRDAIAHLTDKHKIFPLGLNYLVYQSASDSFLRGRGSLENELREKIASLVRGHRLERFSFGKFHTPRANELHQPPDFVGEPKVIFMARVWNENHLAADFDRDAIFKINQMRAECVRSLRREFGKRFYGGFAHDEHARANFSDCLLSDPALAHHRNYLKHLRGFSVCVATTGLLGSIGWKMAEYAAFSKAIVCEPLNYVAPGDFAANKNYLEFKTPADCVAAVARLFDDHELRVEMMMNNYRYYQAYLKPDALVLRTLAIALGAVSQ